MDATPRREALVRPGDVIEGRYRIIRMLGEGGMGTVFLAEHTLISRRVAIKFLHPELATDAIVVERFMNEARAAGTLGHPNIVESTDMGFQLRDGSSDGVDHQVPYIAFEYLEGTLLTTEIYRTGGLSVRRAVRIATQIASALHAAHNAGIVHRDLKSDNVFLTDKAEAADHVKVIDFGISRFLMQEDQQKTMVMGTPEFMAPEQIMAPESVDNRADVYALGVILYEALSARRPFTGDSARQVLHRIVHDAPPPLVGRDIPHGLADLVVGHMLAKNPDDRPPSMVDVEAALAAFDGRPNAPAKIKRRRTPLAGPEPAVLPNVAQRSTGAKRPYALYAAIAVSVAFGATGTVLGLRGTGESEATLIPPSPEVLLVQPEAPSPVTLRVEANAPNAQILMRRRTSAVPISLDVVPAHVEELIEISAPNRKTVRYWMTFDHPVQLRAQLPTGSGAIDATPAETAAAFRPIDEPHDQGSETARSNTSTAANHPPR